MQIIDYSLLAAAGTSWSLIRLTARNSQPCRSPLLSIMDAETGKVTQTFPIGAGVDTNIYEPETGLLFTATREGTLHIFHQDAPNKFNVVETVAAHAGARNVPPPCLRAVAGCAQRDVVVLFLLDCVTMSRQKNSGL